MPNKILKKKKIKLLRYALQKKLKLYIVSHFKFNIVNFLTTDINVNIFAIPKNI